MTTIPEGGKALLSFLATRLLDRTGPEPFWKHGWFTSLRDDDCNRSLAIFYAGDSDDFDPWQHLLCGLKFWRNCLSHCQYVEIPYYVSLFPAELVPFAVSGKIDRFLRSFARPPKALSPPRKEGKGERRGGGKRAGGGAGSVSFGPACSRSPFSSLAISVARLRPPSFLCAKSRLGQAAAQAPSHRWSRTSKRIGSALSVYSQQREVGSAANAGLGLRLLG